MTGGYQKLWPDVSSPLARRVLAYLFNQQGTYTGSDFESDMAIVEQEHALKGLTELWEKIQHSDIGIQLAMGPEYLPDITTRLTRYQRTVFGFLKPRTLEQHVQMIVNNLDWYLDPNSCKPRLYRYFEPLFFTLILVAFIALYVVGRVFYNVSNLFLDVLPFILLVMLVWFIGSTLFGLFGDSLLTRNTRATVLYHYLRRVYSDVEENEDNR